MKIIINQFTIVKEENIMQIEKMSFDYGNKCIFKNVCFNISNGKKVGLVG